MCSAKTSEMTLIAAARERAYLLARCPLPPTDSTEIRPGFSRPLLPRCLLLPEGMRELATGLASYSLLSLVLQLLRVGPWVESVFPLTLREAQGILFAVQV